MRTQHSQFIDHLLRAWRQRPGQAGSTAAAEANIFPKHVSFLETGRALPSRKMLLHLAQLHIPLREQNLLLVAAGYAPTFTLRPRDAPMLHGARCAR